MQIFPLQTSVFADKRFNDCLVIFLGLEELDAENVSAAYLSWSSSNVMPPTTLIVGRSDSLVAFKREHESVDGRLSGLDRLYRNGDRGSVVLGGFDYRGGVFIIDDGATTTNLRPVVEKAIEVFVESQIATLDVVIPAPPGTYFKKLSGRFSSHFIRAEALLQSTSAIELLALRILPAFAHWCDMYPVTGADCPSIFIDTMSVWPVAEKLCQLHKFSNPVASEYRIASFKSYEGLRDWDPSQRRAFVLISATTSDGLAQKVREKFLPAKVEVWTILSLTEELDRLGLAEGPKCIFSIKRKLSGRSALDGLRSTFEPDISQLPLGTETINIVGERFLSQPARPKRVRLVHSTLDDGTKRTLAKIARQKITKVARGRFDGHGRWSLSFDPMLLLKSASTPEISRTESLLRAWLRNYSSPSPVAIIYPSSSGPSAPEVLSATVAMADQTADILKELMPGAHVFKLSSNELAVSSRHFPEELGQCSVIVVAPVIGNGFVFKQISALLRHKQPTGPRLFLALAALPESAQQFNQLKSDISGVSTDDRRYDFKCLYTIPVGRIDRAVQWREELEVLHEVAVAMGHRSVSVPAIDKRIEKLESLAVMEDDAVFLPNAKGAPLMLSSGFFLWEGSTDIEGKDLGAAVLMTISALLQGTRAEASKTHLTSLRTGLFQHALICPDMFTRFNDAVIQAALLRAAYPEELNYSVSEEMSHDMERLLIKWLQYSEHPVGAAAGEFLLALALGKLKLRKEHLANVIQEANKLKGWLGCLALVAGKRTRSSL